MLSDYVLNCTVDKGVGKHLDVTVYRKIDPSSQSSGQRRGGSEEKGEEVMFLERAVSFKEAINFREKFDKFVELGVGGMKKEINELYRRAFASRGIATIAEAILFAGCRYMYCLADIFEGENFREFTRFCGENFLHHH